MVGAVPVKRFLLASVMSSFLEPLTLRVFDEVEVEHWSFWVNSAMLRKVNVFEIF